MKNTRMKKVAATGVGVLALAGVGTGVAMADAPTPATPAAAQAQHVKHPGQHGTFTRATRKHGTQTRDFQRGTVTAVNPGSITLRSRDGFTATYTVDLQTKVRKDKQGAQIGQVAVGDRVGLVAAKNGATDAARHINDRGNKPVAPAPAAPQPTS